VLNRGRQLRQSGVLGLNERNIEYIQKYNARKLFPLVDDKLQTKRLALAAGMAVPELYGVLASHHDIRNFPQIVAGHPGFVIKPAHGSGGDGILVIPGEQIRSNGCYQLIDGTFISEPEIGHHVSNIISGQYSLVGTRDCALVERCIRVDATFESLCYQGVPDIRVIVLNGYPVIAMARLPTRRSKGKANLHQGAVGIGIDLTTGTTLNGVMDETLVREHPDTGVPVSGLAIPQWEELLLLSASCYPLTGLGYLGVDIILDRDFGPLILELNARPGLSIQIANQCGLRNRLRLIETQDKHSSVEKKVMFSREHFSSKGYGQKNSVI